MLLATRSFKRQRFRLGDKPFYSERCYRTLFRRSAAPPSRIMGISAAGGGALTATLMLFLGNSLYADVPSDSPLKEPTPTPTPLSKLLTSYAVYSACSLPGLVEASPTLLALCSSIPGLRQLAEGIVRFTFFKQVFFLLQVHEIRILILGIAVQFVGGDTAHECLPLIRKLRAENKGALLAYTVEADANEGLEDARSTDEPHQPIVQLIRAVEIAARFEDSLARETSSRSGRRTWVAVKLARALLLSPGSETKTISWLIERPFTELGRSPSFDCLSCLAPCARTYAISGLPTHRRSRYPQFELPTA